MQNNEYCKNHFSKCGEGFPEYCNGCKENPDGSKLTYDEFRDEVTYWNCDSCVYCDPRADTDRVYSVCKRMDHKKYSFAKAIFYSYDCGQKNGCICGDYKPRNSSVWIENHFHKEYLDEMLNNITTNKTICLCIDHDWEVRYEVLKRDFFLNTFKKDDGSLKWIRKGYCKQSRKSPIGYVYVYEYPDGFIQEKANQPILWDHVPEEYIRHCIGELNG